MQSATACSRPSERRWCGGKDDEDLIMGCSLRPHAVGRLLSFRGLVSKSSNWNCGKGLDNRDAVFDHLQVAN
jgi:hypothetical protein